METRRNAAWGEGALLGLTGLFLCLLLGLFLRDRAALEAPAAVETDLSVPLEEVRHPQMVFRMKLPQPVPPLSLLRRKADLSP